MTTHPDESVYLNAARAWCQIQFSYDPGFYYSDKGRERAINADAAIRARDPFLRAMVDSVWEARGEHDAAALGWRDGYDAAVEELRDVDSRTGSPAARWAAEYLDARREWVAEARDEHEAAAIQRLREIHSPRPCDLGPGTFHALTPRAPHQHCSACGPVQPWPCPTLVALDAQRPAEGGTKARSTASNPGADADPCPHCGPGYRYGDEGCRHTPPSSPEGAAEQQWRGAVNVVVDALPVDPADGTTILQWRGGVDRRPSAIWGAPEKLAEAILSALAVSGHLSYATPAAPDGSAEGEGAR